MSSMAEKDGANPQEAIDPIKRRMTCESATTAPTTSLSSSLEDSMREDEMLIKMIKQEMVHSIMSSGSRCGSGTDSGTDDEVADVEAMHSSGNECSTSEEEDEVVSVIAEAFLASVDAPEQATDEGIRKLLETLGNRSTLSTPKEDEDGEDEEGEREQDDPNKELALSQHTPTNNSSAASRRTATGGTTSGHSSTTDRQSGAAGAVANKNKMSLNTFIEKYKDFDSDREEEDDDSDISDLTGTTGVFSQAIEPTKKAKEARKIILETLPHQPPAPRVYEPQHQEQQWQERQRTQEKQAPAEIPERAPEAASPEEHVQESNDVGLRTSKRGSMGRRRVRFAVVQCRLYERIMTDNPACASGPPIGIGWAFAETDVKTVDQRAVDRDRKKLRRDCDLILSRRARERIVERWGYSEKQVAEMMRAVNKIKTQRRQTVNNLGAQKLEEIVERAKRKVKKVLKRRKK